jgi:hypothetical protein
MGRAPRFSRADGLLRFLLAELYFSPAVLLACGFALASEPARDPAQDLSHRIDAHIFQVLEQEQITPAPTSDDAEFFRRAWLDIAGKIPAAMDVRDFLADEDPDKRRRAIERLLESPGYISHFSAVWREALIPEANMGRQLRFMSTSFDPWLRQRLADNVAYDAIVRELLTTPVDRTPEVRGTVALSGDGPTPVAFYIAKQGAPENLAASTARVFLGVRIECAQCHDHPFDSWKQEQFWRLAAFFSGFQPAPGERANQVREAFPQQRQIGIPGTDKIVEAVFLDGSTPPLDGGEPARAALARWVTTRHNPYFARAAANRLWAHFFGVGLVEPPDDFSENNPPSHPELLDELARAFAAQGFDLKFLIRAIASSRAYQLSSRRTHPSQDAPQRFARMAVKGLTAAQMLDSLSQATGYVAASPPTTAAPFQVVNARSEILETFANDAEPAVQRQTTIVQALALMNGSFISQAVSLDQSRALLAITGFPMRPAERVEALFLATLSRQPRLEELERLSFYVMDGGPTADPDRALAEVFWALLNSSEFGTNH